MGEEARWWVDLDPDNNEAQRAVVDTGTDPEDAVLLPWVLDRYPFVSDDDTGYSHGSLVAGVAIHGRYP